MTTPTNLKPAPFAVDIAPISVSVAVILVFALLVGGCVPSRIQHHSEYPQSHHDYHQHDENHEYERQQPEYRQPNYNNRHPNRQYEVPQIREREQPRYNQRSHDHEQQHPQQIEQPKIKPQDNSTSQISTPPVRTRTVEQTSPSQISTPPPVITKTPSAPVQPCSRRIGCEDSGSTHTDSSRRER